jgi:hypothetical protein
MIAYSRAAVLLVVALPHPARLNGQNGCLLLSAAEVKAITNEQPTRSRSSVGDRLAYKDFQCSHRSENWRVEVHLERGRDAAGVKAYMKNVTAVVSQTTGNSAKAIPGLGDQAWWGPIDPTNGILHVVKGNDVLWIQTWGKAPGAGSLEKTRALMERVLSNYKTFPSS